VERLRSAGVKPEARAEVVHFGHVPRRIVEIADEIGADPIAIGTRGESDLEACSSEGLPTRSSI
jgi:nucleotide-binding universal stress UspA family protein